MLGLPLALTVVVIAAAVIVFELVFGMLAGRFLRVASRDYPARPWR